MNTIKNLRGGGGYANLTSVKSSFRPLIASSLALALGVSVASAITPNIQYGTNGTADTSSILDSGLTWNGSNGGGTNSFWTLRTTSGSGDPVDIVLQFNKDGNGAGSLSGDIYTVSQNGEIGSSNTNSPILKFSSTTNGIDMQGKTLRFDFLATDESANANWNSGFDETDPKKRKMILNLSGVTQENGKSVSLKGNLEVKAGMGIGAVEKKSPFKYKNSNVFEANFGGSILGNVTIRPSDICDKNGEAVDCDATSKFSDLLSKLIFASGGIDGNLEVTAGESTTVFKSNGYITGDIKVNQYDKKNTGANPQNRIVFASGTAKIGTDTKGSDIIVSNGNIGVGVGQRGSNTIIADSGITNLDFKIGNMSVSGDYIGNPTPYTYGVLSLNNTGTNNIQIKQISSGMGSILIGKNIATYNAAQTTIAYDSNFFDTASTDGIQLKSGIVSEFMKSTYSAEGTFTFGENGKDAISASQTGLNLINVKGTTTIKGNILSSARAYTGHDNVLILTGTSATLGENAKISIKVNNGIPNAGIGKSSKNTILLGATTNTLNLSELSMVGDWIAGGNPSVKNLNILSFNNDSSDRGSKNIDTITALFGNNIVGKNIVTQENGYSSLLFDNGGTDTQIKSGFATEFMKDTYMAEGTYTIGSGSNNALSASKSGGNYLNVKTLVVNGNITASDGGKNYIYTNRITTLSGGITTSVFASGSSNAIVVESGDLSIGSSGDNSIGALNGGTSNSVELKNGNLTLDKRIYANGGSNTVSANQIAISAGGIGNANAGANTITINGSNSTNTITGNMTSDGGNNTITINSATSTNTISGGMTSGGGNNTITINSVTSTNAISGNINASGNGKNTIEIASGNLTLSAGMIAQGYNNSSKNTITLRSGNLVIEAGYIQGGQYTIKTHNAGSNSNVINVTGNFTANGAINAVGGKNEISFSGQGLVTGDITRDNSHGGQNNFTLTADNASLTLKGANNSITTLTAKDDATNGNVLTLDASLNNSVNTTITTVTNGNKLKVDFKGAEGKTTKLTLNTTTNQNLKSVSATNGIDNTLALTGASTMTIADAVSIGETSGNKKGVIFDLSSGSNLTFTNNLTTNTQGIVTFNLGGTSNTLTGTLTNNGINNFNLASATTLQYGNDGLSFSSGENNINFNADNITLNWQGASDSTNHDIATSGATTKTNLNFKNSGTLASGISTSAGTTTINIHNGKTATINGAITTSTGAQTNVLFKGTDGGTTRTGEYSTLVLGETSNQLTSVKSSANAKILLDGQKNATIETTTIDSGASLVFAFTGSDASTVTATNGITVGEGATLGISLGGDDTQTKTISGNVVFNEGSTLLVDFLDGNKANGVIGDGGTFTIGKNSKSIINFHGTNSGKLNAQVDGSNSIIVDGGDNTVNFMGGKTAEFGGVTLTSGTNTINVNSADSKTNGIVGTVSVGDIGSVTNTINLGDYATLSLKPNAGGNAGDGKLISSGLNNELNFIGDISTLDGTFGATTGGSASINVGNAEKERVVGIITGEVENATLAFNSGNSALVLQKTQNTFKSINSQATNGVLILDTATNNNNVDVTISETTSISAGKSLTFLFGGDNNSTVTTNGKLTVAGTLGVIINGDGDKKITGDVDLGGRGTLLVEFARGGGTATLGDGTGISIKGGESSIINFRGTGNASLANAISLDGGTSTINFYKDGTVGGIALNSGTSIINVEGESTNGYTVILDGVGDVGNVANIINLGEKATFDVKATKGGNSGSGALTSSSSTKASELNFEGADATFQGGFGAKDSGVATINVNATGASITGNVSRSSLAFGVDGAGITLKGTTNTLTTISAAPTSKNVRSGRMARSVSNTLTLDTTNGNNTTEVSGTLNASGLTVNLAGADATHTATLNLNGGSLGTINVTDDANVLALNSETTSINTFTLASNAGLDIQFNGGGLNAVGGITKDTDKTFKLLANRGNSFVSGGNIDANTLEFTSGSTLAVRNAQATFAEISGSGTLTLDGANAGSNVEVTATSVSGNNITANFNGNANGGNTLVLSNTTTLADITFGANSTNNTISVASTKTLTIAKAEEVSVGSGNAITFSLASGSTLALTNGMTSSGDSIIDVDTSATLSGGNINVSQVNLNGTTTSELKLTATSTDIATLNANAPTSNTLILDGTSSAVTATLHIINGALNVEMKGDASKVATLNLNGGSIASVSATNGDATQNIINFNSGTTTITQAIDVSKVASGKGLTLNLNGGNLILSNNIDTITNSGGEIKMIINNATLSLNGTTETNGEIVNKVNSLSGNGGTIDFVGSTSKASTRANPRTFTPRKTLTTDSFSGNLNAVVYASKTSADQIIVNNGSSKGTLTISAQGNINEILSITKDDGVVVAKVGTNGITVQGGESVIDGIVLDLTVEPDTQTTGDYLIGKSVTKGVDTSIQEIASTTLTVNYDLFLANFNSLNKRMGELRDNPYSNGVWARAFGGAMSSEFNTGSKTEYVTLQAGYDYSLTLGDAKNYMGIALAYGKSWTKANDGAGLTTSSLSNVDSNMVEVGVYNSYVADSGWYNDTIFKFDYIMSDFTLSAGSNTADNNTNNFAMVLSDEFGYRYKFAENEKGNWYIDPQVEVAFGYFNQSDFNHVLNTQSNIVMKATQDTILTLRTRAGLSLGKKFNTTKGFASLYVGAFYEYDYINGGDSEATLSGGMSGNQLSKVESNGRAILNVGSNIGLTESARLYIDVEKSFGDKQRTFMQFNVGARYSF